MKISIFKSTAWFLLLILCLKKCVTSALENRYSNFYYMKNQVFALREELQVDGVEEDSSFTGGFGVKFWLVLPSSSYTFLIGIKRRGLNLITISKKDGNLFQAVEKPMDIEGNITSAIAFNILNNYNQRTDGLVVISTDSPKYEIIWFKIQNYRLVQIWSWTRYSGTLSMQYFKVVEERREENRLLVLDSSGTTAHVYSLSMDAPTPSIRELEIISFEKKALALSVSILLPEPFLYVVHKNELGIYRYKKICRESWIGNFEKMTSLKDMIITHIYPFQSDGQEYLAIAGKDSAILRIEAPGTIISEMDFEDILEWLIMRTGPHKERILLFGKSASGDVRVFSNVGVGWSPHPSPPCYKYSREKNEKLETHKELRCLRVKSWIGVAYLEKGDLPTLIFSDRKYFGEMFHVMLKMKREMLPFDVIQPSPGESTNNLMKMKSNLDGLVSDIEKNKLSGNACTFFSMLKTIEQIVSRAKEEFYDTCSKSANFSSQMRYKGISNGEKYEDSTYSNNMAEQNINNDLFKTGDESQKMLEAVMPSSATVKSTRFPQLINTHPISPDLVDEGQPGFEVSNDMIDFNIAGFSKKKETLFN